MVRERASHGHDCIDHVMWVRRRDTLLQVQRRKCAYNNLYKYASNTTFAKTQQ